MLNSISGFFLNIIFITSSLSIMAQESAPYSRFGLGEIISSDLAASKGMGSLSAGYRDPLHLNFNNPSSYTSLSLTTLEAGVNFNTKRMVDGLTDSTYKTGDGFLDYLTFGFPVSDNAGLSFGVIPYSKMRYDFAEDLIDTAMGTSTTKFYNGSGRTYQLYIGGAYEFLKKDTTIQSLSVGMNVIYLFGNLNQREILVFPDSLNNYSTRITSTKRLSNLVLNPGIQYQRRLVDNNKERLYLIAGAYSHFPVVSGSGQELTWDRFLVVSNILASDTVSFTSNPLRDFKAPVKIGVGASLDRINKKRGSKLVLGVDFSYTWWSNFVKLRQNVTIQNSWRVAMGADYRPNFQSPGLFKRMNYRIGGWFDSGYLQVSDQQIKEYGITFGFSLPMKTAFSRLNFSFEYGGRGTRESGLIREQFFRAYIAFTLNDKWFIKRKYD